MAISINDNLGVQANKPIDDRYGPYVGADEAAAILAANNAVPSARRFRGLVVGLNINGVISEYWYKDGVANENLVVKQTDLSEIEAELDFALQNVVAKAPLTPAFDLTGAFEAELNETYVFSGQFINARPEYTALFGGGRLFYNFSSERWELRDGDNIVRYWHPFDSYDPALLQSIAWSRVTGESSAAHTLTLSRRNAPSDVTSVNGETGAVTLTAADVGAQPDLDYHSHTVINYGMGLTIPIAPSTNRFYNLIIDHPNAVETDVRIPSATSQTPGDQLKIAHSTTFSNVGTIVRVRQTTTVLDEGIPNVVETTLVTLAFGESVTLVCQANQWVVVPVDQHGHRIFKPETSTPARSGFVPAPADGDTVKFLRGDGTWATVSSGVAAHKSTHATGGTDALTPSDIGAAANTNFTGATSSTAGTAGLVPAPSAGGQNMYLKADGDWGTLPKPDITEYFERIGDATSQTVGYGQQVHQIVLSNDSRLNNAFIGATAVIAGTKGLVPKPLSGDQDKYLKGDGTWAEAGVNIVDRPEDKPTVGDTQTLYIARNTEELHHYDVDPSPNFSVSDANSWAQLTGFPQSYIDGEYKRPSDQVYYNSFNYWERTSPVGNFTFRVEQVGISGAGGTYRWVLHGPIGGSQTGIIYTGPTITGIQSVPNTPLGTVFIGEPGKSYVAAGDNITLTQSPPISRYVKISPGVEEITVVEGAEENQLNAYPFYLKSNRSYVFVTNNLTGGYVVRFPPPASCSVGDEIQISRTGSAVGTTGIHFYQLMPPVPPDPANWGATRILTGGAGPIASLPYITYKYSIVNGVALWRDESLGSTILGPFTGATQSAGGKQGIVPAPASANRSHFLRGDGSWAQAEANFTNTFFARRWAFFSDSGLWATAASSTFVWENSNDTFLNSRGWYRVNEGITWNPQSLFPGLNNFHIRIFVTCGSNLNDGVHCHIRRVRVSDGAVLKFNGGLNYFRLGGPGNTQGNVMWQSSGGVYIIGSNVINGQINNRYDMVINTSPIAGWSNSTAAAERLEIWMAAYSPNNNAFLNDLVFQVEGTNATTVSL
jgi:hypothetical protein